MEKVNDTFIRHKFDMFEIYVSFTISVGGVFMFGQNPYYQTYPSASTNVVRVNGENGARMYNIGASSSALLLDENNPIVWLIQTDGAGYKTVTPYKIEPYVQEPEPSISDLIKRIEHLEGIINESNITKNERTKKSEKPEQL